jgi:hypothetical protein
MSIESELVDQVFSCPVCHNNVMDILICDDVMVTCTKCNTVYNPHTMEYERHYKFNLLNKTVEAIVRSKQTNTKAH